MPIRSTTDKGGIVVARRQTCGIVIGGVEPRVGRGSGLNRGEKRD